MVCHPELPSGVSTGAPHNFKFILLLTRLPSLAQILVNRLVLNLRMSDNPEQQTTRGTQTTSVFIAASDPIIGNIGAQVRLGSYEGYDDDMDDDENIEGELVEFGDTEIQKDPGDVDIEAQVTSRYAGSG